MEKEQSFKDAEIKEKLNKEKIDVTLPATEVHVGARTFWRK